MQVSFKQLSYLLLAGVLLKPAMAVEPLIALRPGLTMKFNLEPNKREEFTNFSFQTVTATCYVDTEDQDGDDVFVEVLRKSGEVDYLGTVYALTAGDNVLIRIFDKATLKITAKSGGKVALTNQGTHAIVATCST